VETINIVTGHVSLNSDKMEIKAVVIKLTEKNGKNYEED
jgi:hypothetical protein